jgi:hexosaminidase
MKSILNHLKKSIMVQVKQITFLLIISIAWFSCTTWPNREYLIIPLPVEANIEKGIFKPDNHTQICYSDSSLEEMAKYASGLLKSGLEFELPVLPFSTNPKAQIVLGLLDNFEEILGNEGYKLEISKNGVHISANKEAGILYGIQSLNQLFDASENKSIPFGKIVDYPRFPYRGLHLDVSRHFMPIEFIYKLIDYMAMHKLNQFHWHLVDDQGWRLEIKKYPKLTEIGGWRTDIDDRHWNDRPIGSKNNKNLYGGFYTQEQVRGLVAYAAKRNITVIPEIEMPAHVMSALAAYPEYSCTGKNLGVPPGGVWPITHIYCAGNDETFAFLEGILEEVMEMFPSKYIHIGGDEADKEEWKKCRKCQARIKNEKLEDEHGLQSYFIKRIESYLNKKGRMIIGWDEILEGGLAPNATVMSWRGEEGGIKAAKMGNKVIMTPGSHCYFDHYQGDPSIEPLAIGGYTTLAKVYSYEPVPDTLTTEEAKYILGAQANVWTEYMPNPEQVEYMIFPRLAAMSEVLWSAKGSRNWASFSKRMDYQYKRYDKLGINYSLSAFQVKTKEEVMPEKKTLTVELSTDAYNPEIRYTLDGSLPGKNSQLYTKPIEISSSSEIKAAIFGKEKQIGKEISKTYHMHKAFGKSLGLTHPNSKQYDAKGPYSLVDGIKGTTNHADGNWQGFDGNDMIALIDLETSQDIEGVQVEVLQNYDSWIFFPKSFMVETSTDGKVFDVLDKQENKISPYERGRLLATMSSSKSAKGIRFLRVTLNSIGVCPKGHTGEGKPAWLFVSEIVIN